MTPQDVITEARYIFQDVDTDGLRQEDTELLIYVNDAIKEASKIAPNLFHQTGDLTCQSGYTEQSINANDAQAFVKVIRIKDGKAVHECDMDFLQKFNPDWNTLPAAAAYNWMKSTSGDPRRFYIVPAAPSNQVLEIIFVRNPTEYGLNDTITDLPPAAKPALANYVIARAESKDDEHVNSGRAVAHFQLFHTYFAPAQQGG